MYVALLLPSSPLVAKTRFEMFRSSSSATNKASFWGRQNKEMQFKAMLYFFQSAKAPEIKPRTQLEAHKITILASKLPLSVESRACTSTAYASTIRIPNGWNTVLEIMACKMSPPNLSLERGVVVVIVVAAEVLDVVCGISQGASRSRL